MIQKIFHVVWLGSKVPELTKNYIDTFKKHNPDFAIILWTDANITTLLTKYKDIVTPSIWRRAKLLCQKADIIRVLALYEYGGFYVDADVECLRSFAPLLHKQFIVGLQEYAPPDKRRMICNAVMGAEAKHPVLFNYMLAFDKALTDDRTSIGPKLLTKVCNDNDITPEPRKMFYPFMWWERQNYNTGDAFTNHHWWGN